MVTVGSELSLVAGRHRPEHKAQRPAPGPAVGPRPSAHFLAQKTFLVIMLRHSMARAVPVQNHQRKHFSPKINLGTSLLSCTEETLTNSLKTPILCAMAFQGLFKLSTNFSKAFFLMVIPGFKHLFPQFCVVVISHLITHRCMRTPNSGSAHPKPNHTEFYCATTSYKDSAGGRGLKAQSRTAPQGLLLLCGAQLPPLHLGKLCHFIPLWPQSPATRPLLTVLAPSLQDQPFSRIFHFYCVSQLEVSASLSAHPPTSFQPPHWFRSIHLSWRESGILNSKTSFHKESPIWLDLQT